MFGLTYLDIAIIFVYVSVIIYLGWWAKKKVQSSGDYFMGDRRGSKIMMIGHYSIHNFYDCCWYYRNLENSMKLSISVDKFQINWKTAFVIPTLIFDTL
ncbi:MAG: hypothetical protein KJ799_18685 [Bacteroidetes bacterium]|nr:hypothetical protein [Bacteroidota bacterium]MBU1678650.1 hypothetical protein [Bacteroidota bacterium]MBU2508725.1 hypothetical protein [Bacteroidota bacterium]